MSEAQGLKQTIAGMRAGFEKNLATIREVLK